jgi:hypothetical protein
MAATSEARALPFFTDLFGQPLESGFIYIGQAGLDPVAYPAVVTSDIAGTVVVAQPIRTTHGHAAAAGALIHLFVQIPYSITILDGAGRLVYASLNETDPVALAIGSSSVQSASDLAALRARSGSSTNQVWVSDIGMYLNDPTDTTSPENIPFIIVGNDGARYHLSLMDANISYAKISGVSPGAKSQGCWVSWNDDAHGTTFLTNNRGTGSGGFSFQTVSADGGTIVSTVVISGDGSVTAANDVVATDRLISGGGMVALASDSSVNLNWDGTKYNLPGGPVSVNGSLAITQATFQGIIRDNQLANGIGSVAVGGAGGVNPPQPGTYVPTGTSANTVFLFVRTA